MKKHAKRVLLLTLGVSKSSNVFLVAATSFIKLLFWAFIPVDKINVEM